jgi:hypothetical protein
MRTTQHRTRNQKQESKIMATFTQAIEAANTVLKSAAVASVNIEFMSIAGIPMSATVTRTGLENVKPLN